MEIVEITSERFKAKFLPKSMSSRTSEGLIGKDEPVFWWEAEALIEDRRYGGHVRFFVSTRKVKYAESGSFLEELLHPIKSMQGGKNSAEVETFNNAILDCLLQKAFEIGGTAPAFPLPRFDFKIGQKPGDGCDLDVESLARQIQHPPR